ncbi:MAG: hypothetical protein IH624_12680, partial [Phycisphaerae bacterium]|nr:hypothetical protein [Phycisphaerae bacterium]
MALDRFSAKRPLAACLLLCALTVVTAAGAGRGAGARTAPVAFDDFLACFDPQTQSAARGVWESIAAPEPAVSAPSAAA